MDALTIMIAKDGCEWYCTLDNRSDHLEEGRLAVGNAVVQLIPGENHKVDAPMNDLS